MTDDIPFDKNFDLAPGRAEEVAPGVRRILANNRGPFTFKGTVSYIVGRARSRSSIRARTIRDHIAALLDAVRGETVTHIFVTHTHRDHSPAVPAIKAATGATVFAEGPHRASRPLNAGEAPRMEACERHGLPARPRARRRRGGERRRLDARGGHDARPHRQPHGVRAARTPTSCSPAIT